MRYQESLEFMVNERKYTYDYFKKNDFSDFQFLSSWEKNYQTWINNKIFPTLVIKYENLIKHGSTRSHNTLLIIVIHCTKANVIFMLW